MLDIREEAKDLLNSTSTPCLTLFTPESAESVRKNDGSVYWKINPQRGMDRKYAVLVQNKRKALAQFGEWDFVNDHPHEHGHAFLVAIIRDIVPVNIDGEVRFRVRFSSIAQLDPTIANCWKGGWRMPINYEQTLEGLGIHLSALTWEPVQPRSQPEDEPKGRDTEAITEQVAPASKLEAVEQFAAAQFGVDVSEVEVVVNIRRAPIVA